MSGGVVQWDDEPEDKPPPMPPPEPAPAKRAGMVTAGDAMPDAPSSGSGKPSALETFGDFLLHGGSLGSSDEAFGQGYDMAGPQITRLTRGTGGVPTGRTSYDVGTDAKRGELDEERAAHPIAATAGEVVGLGAVTAPLSIAAAATSPLALLGEGALLAGDIGYNESRAPTVGGRAQDAAESAAIGGPVNALIPGTARAGARALESMGETLGKAASNRRLGAWGAYGSDVAAAKAAKGATKVDSIARRGEELGLGGVKSWQDTERAAGTVTARVGQRIDELNEAATGAGVRVNLGKVADAMDAEANALRKTSNLPEMQSEAAEIQSQADGLRATKVTTPQQASARADRIMQDAVDQSNAIIEAAKSAPPQMQNVAVRQAQDLFAAAEAKAAQVQRGAEFPDEVPFAQAHRVRQWLDGKVWDNTKASFAKPEASAKADMYRKMAGLTRQAIGEGMEGAGASDVRAALKEANADYEAAAFARDAAAKRVAREGGNQAVSTQTLISAPISGATAFGASGGDAGKSALAILGSAALTEGGKRYGNAAAATGMRGAESALMSIARPMQPATAALAGAARRGVIAEAAPRAAGVQMAPAMASNEAPTDQAPASMAPADVLSAIDAVPQAFGEYTPVIRQAAQAGDQETIDWAMSQLGR